MAQQELRTNIVIGARTDNSLSRAGTELTEFTSIIDGITDKLYDYGKESAQLYANYDDALRDAADAGRLTATELEKLDKINRSVVKERRTIYSNLDAANATTEMIKRGKDLLEIETMLPDVLNLAQAGNLAMADSVDILLSSLAGLQMEAEGSDWLTDMLVVGANMSAADIDTFGESMIRLGSAMDFFAGSAPEVITLLSALSDYGEDMRGSEGGTALRNFALNLIAPSGNKKAVVAALETLGMSEEEFQDYLDEEDISLTASAAAIEGLGLQLYDENNELRDMIDIIYDLGDAVDALDEKSRNEVLAQIFGKRNTVAAMNLLDAARQGTIVEYFAAIMDSEGAAGERAAYMQGGIGGAMREFSAAWEELKTTFGSHIAPELEWMADTGHSIVTWVSELDPVALNAFTSAGETMVIAATTTAVGGSALRLLGSLLGGSHGVMIAATATLAAAGVTALVSAINTAAEIDFEEAFGTMEADSEAISAHLRSISGAFADDTKDYEAYTAAVNNAFAAYQNASQQLSGELLTAMLTGAKLTDQDIESLNGLGEEMYRQLMAGVDNASAQAAELLELLYSDDPADRAKYDSLMENLDAYYLDMYANAESVGENMRKALTAAFEDGEVSEDEYQNILNYMRDYNRAMAEAAAQARSEQQEAERRAMLDRIQSLGWDSAETEIAKANAMRDADMQYWYEETLPGYYSIEVATEKEIASGKLTEAEIAQEEKYLDELKADVYAELEAIKATSDAFSLQILDTLFEGSEHDAAWDMIRALDMDALGDDPYNVAKHLVGNYSMDDILAMYGLYLSRDFMKLTKGLGGGTYTALEAAGLAVEDYYGISAALQTINETPLEPEVELPDGRADMAAYISAAQGYANGNSVYVNVATRSLGGGTSTKLPGLSLFAEGGRATVPSIFGDAGAEWAIPEAHTRRTAELLNAARAASGFSWGEIMAASGGFGRSVSREIIYRPTIYANDVRGVERALKEDKLRLKRMLDDMELKDSVSVYA